MRKRNCIILISLLLCIFSLSAKKDDVFLSLSYSTEPFLQLRYGPPPVLACYSSGDTKIYPDTLTALLGTLTLETNAKNFKNPTMTHLTISENVYMKGYVKDPCGNIMYKDDSKVNLRAIPVVRDTVIGSYLIHNGTVPLAPNPGNVMPNATTMHIYLVMVAENRGYDYFIPGVVYSLNENSTIGNFGFSASGQGNQTFTDIPIELNGGGTGATHAPFIPGAIAPGAQVDIPFEGDGFAFNHEYLFSIISNPAFFDLQTAQLGLHQTVATVQLQVVQAEKNKEYGVEIAFTSNNPTGFMLHHNGDRNEYGIPYSLHFGPHHQQITHNQFFVWKNLFTGTSTIASMESAVSVSVSDHIAIRGAPLGAYSDIVTVSIIPLDTIM